MRPPKIQRIYLLVFSISFYTIQAQDSIATLTTQLRSSYVCGIAPNFKMVSEGTIRTMIRRDFSFLVINRDQSAAGAGTGFTLDVANDKTMATYNFAFLNGSHKERSLTIDPAKWIFSGSVQAGYSNAIGTLFSNTKANGKAGATVKYSRIITAGPKNNVPYCNSIVPVTQAYIDHLTTKARIETINYANLQNAIQSKVADIIVIQNSIDALPAGASFALLVLLERRKNEEALLASYRLQAAGGPLYAKTVLLKQNDSLIEYELKTVKWNKQTIGWWEIEGGGNVGSYNVFDDIATFKNNDTTVGQWQITGSINFLMNWKKTLFYWRIAYKNASATNLDGATSYTLEESAIFNNGATQGKIGNSVNAFKLSEAGAFERFRTHSFQGDAIFMFAKNTLGVHGFLDVGYNYSTELYTNTGVLNGGIGLIFTVFDHAKEKAKVNIEPFFKLKDINAQTKVSEKYSTWERYTFGIKVGVPFNKVLL